MRRLGKESGDVPLAAAALACMGVVFGDIGTSPLYALSVAVKSASPNGQVTPEAVLGIVSLIFWALIVVISIKYAILIMRADNHGEGGILALLALVNPRRSKPSRGAFDARCGRAPWRDLALRRRHHNARDLRAQRDRGRETLRPPDAACRRAADGRHSGHSVRHPAQRHLMDRRHIRPGHAPVVRCRGPAWPRRDRQVARRAGGAQSVGRGHVSLACGAFGVCGHRRRLPRGHRRRGVLRRHGPFRSAADPGGLVRRRPAGSDAELLRTGRPASRRAQSARGRSTVRFTRWALNGRTIP